MLAVATAIAAGGRAALAGSSESNPTVRPSGQLPVSEVTSPYGMVAAGLPEAARAGALMLEQGGNAVDAAIAAAFAAGVVDPLNAGLGGQCYILIHLRDGREVAVDGSAPVPLRVVPAEIQPLKEGGFLWGYKLVATPATPAALAHALRRYGTMSLAQVLAPAIDLAEFGYRTTPSILSVTDHYADRIRENETLARELLQDGLFPFPIGHLYCRPALADTFRRLARNGVDDFYSGSIADEIAADMAAHGGYVSKMDLGLLRPTERTPVRGRYRGLEVVAFPYPGGGEILIEALQILDAFPPELLQQDGVDRLHLLLEAMNLAFRVPAGKGTSQFLGTAFLDAARSRRRAALIRFDRALTEAELPVSQDEWFGDRDTTQVSVVDSSGNAVALTQTNGYGAFVATPTLGFEYNSMLESGDFCSPAAPNSPVPLRTVRTSMTPTIVLCDGTPFLVLGGAGSSRIPGSIVTVVTNIVDRGMPLKEAVVAPRALATRSSPAKDRSGCRAPAVDPFAEEKTYIEVMDPIKVEQADVLALRGFSEQKRVTSESSAYDRRLFGGVNVVMVDQATGLFVGVGDPRRVGGVAAPARP